jgi:peptidoglycan/LPS O-acetylase OafA/YrhL
MLDALRFIAAAAVMLYHFTAIHAPMWGIGKAAPFPHLGEATRYGYLGVNLFFFISGFVILMTAWGRSVPQFVASRAGRLLPAYWAGVLLTGALLVLTRGELKPVAPLSVVTNLTMVQTAFGVNHVDGVYWTLWVELRFYLIIGLLVLAGITRGRILAFAMIWPVVGAMAKQGGNDFISQLLIADYAPYFAAGMLLYVVYREGWSVLLALLIGFNVALSLTRAVEVTAPIVRHTGGKPNLVVAAAIVLICFVMVAVMTTTRMSRIRWRWLTTLGLLTYPLYVIHEYWGLYVVSLVHGRLGRPLSVLVAIVVSLAAAWLINRFVERPFGPWLRRATLGSLTRSEP